MTTWERLQIRDALASAPPTREARRFQEHERQREESLIREAEMHVMRQYLKLRDMIQSQSFAGSRPPERNPGESFTTGESGACKGLKENT